MRLVVLTAKSHKHLSHQRHADMTSSLCAFSFLFSDVFVLQSLRAFSIFSCQSHLKAEDLVLELADRPGLGEAERLGGLLHGADHGRRTADEDLDVGCRGGKTFLRCAVSHPSSSKTTILLRTYLDHVRSHEANATGPACRRVVEHVVHAEARVLARKLVQVLLQKNILLVDVCEDEVDLSLVAGSSASEDGLGDLQHGSDTGTASNHTKVPDHVGSVDHGALGALYLHLVANVESREVTADVTGRVALDEQVEVAGVDIGGDRSVGAHDFLVGDGLGLGVLDIEVGGDGNVLADGQAEDAVGSGQGEAVDGGVVREDGLLGKRELFEDGGVKDLLLLCEGGVSEGFWFNVRDFLGSYGC